EWGDGIELAMGEAFRTESSFWVDVLAGYVERGLTVTYEPAYFGGLLEMLRHLDVGRFERFIGLLWNSYRESDCYLEWVDMVNGLLGEMDVLRSGGWKRLPDLYSQGYEDLIGGRYFIRDIGDIIQGLFPIWLEVSFEYKKLVP